MNKATQVMVVYTSRNTTTVVISRKYYTKVWANVSTNNMVRLAIAIENMQHFCSRSYIVPRHNGWTWYRGEA